VTGAGAERSIRRRARGRPQSEEGREARARCVDATHEEPREDARHHSVTGNATDSLRRWARRMWAEGEGRIEWLQGHHIGHRSAFSAPPPGAKMTSRHCAASCRHRAALILLALRSASGCTRPSRGGPAQTVSTRPSRGGPAQTVRIGRQTGPPRGACVGSGRGRAAGGAHHVGWLGEVEEVLLNHHGYHHRVLPARYH
jgi:hypothetical protein